MKNANLVSSVKWVAQAVMLGLLLCASTGCGRKADADDRAPKSVQHYMPLKVGAVALQAQFAVHFHEMQQGLMHRRDLGADQGMLFVYSQPQRMSYYMKNTPTALDIGFFTADGVLQEIYQLVPFDERPVSSVGGKLQYALEMNKGWFAANGLRPGARLDLKAVRLGLRQRGFDPEIYGLGENR